MAAATFRRPTTRSFINLMRRLQKTAFVLPLRKNPSVSKAWRPAWFNLFSEFDHIYSTHSVDQLVLVGEALNLKQPPLRVDLTAFFCTGRFERIDPDRRS